VRIILRLNVIDREDVGTAQMPTLALEAINATKLELVSEPVLVLPKVRVTRGGVISFVSFFEDTRKERGRSSLLGSLAAEYLLEFLKSLVKPRGGGKSRCNRESESD